MRYIQRQQARLQGGGDCVGGRDLLAQLIMAVQKSFEGRVLSFLLLFFVDCFSSPKDINKLLQYIGLYRGIYK